MEPALSSVAAKVNAIPQVLLHIPHASTVIPSDVRDQFVLSEAELAHELVRMTDWHTDVLFTPPDARFEAVEFPVSRLVLDPERFEDDTLEVMADRGMGVIYTQTSLRTPLRRAISGAERQQLLDWHFHPHHARLTAACERALEAHGTALVIDCHSFASRPLPYELDQDPDRPDICLGTDAFHTPPDLRDRVRAAFERSGWSVAIDRPFAGALVPMRHCRRDARLQALMIEVNRGLYLEEGSGERGEGFGEVAGSLRGVLLELTDGLPVV